MKLTDENYFSKEANMYFCSASQYKSFFENIPPMPACEARTLAELNGDWERDTTESLLLGSFVDCMLLEPEKLDSFKESHPELFTSKDVICVSDEIMIAKHPDWFTKNGTLKSTISIKKIKEEEPSFIKTQYGKLLAKYEHGITMVERIKKDELFMRFVNNSKHQVVMTGEIEGVPVKIKIDCLGEKFIFDLKTTQSLEKEYFNPTEKEWNTFIKAFGYHYQGAIYSEVVRQNTGKTLPFIVGAVTSEKHPTVDVFEIDADSLDEVLEDIKQHIVSVPMLKEKKIPARRCEKCDYCKDTRVLTKIGDWLGREEIEDD